MITFADCKQDNGLVTVANVCADTDRFAYLVNTSVARLLRRGDFAGTVVPIQVCVQQGCIAFPRYVGTVRRINTCRHSLPAHNLWYRFIDSRECRSPGWGGFQGPEAGFSNIGSGPSYSNVWGEGRLIRAYISTPQDAGKTLRLFGVDNGNQPLRTNNGDGTWSDGITITLASPYGSTSTYVRSIDRVIKDVTQGQVFLYGYNAAADTGVAPSLGLEDLAIYDPGETNPWYTRYQLNTGQGPGCCAGAAISIVALVKLKAIPVKFDTDLVAIDNLEALKFMFQSVIASEANDFQTSRELQGEAVAELNRQLEDESPDEVFAAANNVFGGRTFRNRCF